MLNYTGDNSPLPKQPVTRPLDLAPVQFFGSRTFVDAKVIEARMQRPYSLKPQETARPASYAGVPEHILKRLNAAQP